MIKKILLASLLLSSLHVSSQDWLPDGNGNIKYNNTGGVGIGADGSNWIKLNVDDKITSETQIPSQGRWGLFSYIHTIHTGTADRRLWGAYLLSLNGPGTLTESIGVNALAGNGSSATGTVTNAYGVQTGVQKGNGTITNGYGVYISNIGATNQYGVYQVGSDDKNYFAGKMGIGSEGGDHIKLKVYSNAETASDFPSYGRWNLFSFANTTHTGTVNTSLQGAYLLSLNSGSGTLETSIGVNAVAGNESSGAGTVTNAYGAQVGVQKGNGTVTNGYGLYIKDIAATNQYGIYQEGTSDKNYFAGNVGIGTSTPTTKLHIFNGVSNGNTHVFSDLTVEDDDHVMLSLLTPNNKTAYYGFADQDDDYVAGIQYEHSIDRMVFRVNDHTSDMTIINNGNVGIGTTNPDAKLTVAGNIHSREVKVTVNAGADFVFEDNYNLPSLEEVQQFINENGHLPEVASAKEMESNGIHLAEMNIKLLQKIEELTLYAIEQEKEINELKKVADNNEELKNKVAKLQILVEQLIKDKN